MISILNKIEDVVGWGRIRQMEPLMEHTLLKKGGIAEFYVELDKTEDLIKLVREARKLRIPVVVFGSGAYASFPEGVLKGLVIKNACRQFDKMSMRGTIRDNEVGVAEVLVSAEAGVLMNQLVRFTIEEGLEGLEYQLGLPGTVGGAIYTNAKYKAKNIYARSHLHAIRIMDLDGDVQTYTGELPYFVALDDEYQTEEVIISAIFKLAPSNKKLLWERGEEAVEYRNKKRN